MKDTQHEDRVGLQPLNLVDTPANLIPYKCIWKCGGACYHEAPNERSGRDSIGEIVEKRLSRRSSVRASRRCS